MRKNSPNWALAAAFVAVGCGGGGGGAASSSHPAKITLAANSIVYGAAAASGSVYSITEMSPTGTNPIAVATGVPDAIQLFAINPAAPTQYAFAADATGNGTFGIYLASGLSLTGATQLVAPTYLYVSSITVTQNGQFVVYSAADPQGGNSFLYVVPIAGGTAVQYGMSDASTVSPLDSDTIAYVAPLPVIGSFGIDQVWTRSLSAGPGIVGLQLTTDLTNHLLPVFSPSGAQLAFWEEANSTDTLVVETLAGSTQTMLPNPAGILPQGEAFSPDGSTLVIAGEQNGSGSIFTQPVSGSSAPTSILNSSFLLGNYGVFWTDANGRVAGSIGGMSSAARRLRRANP